MVLMMNLNPKGFEYLYNVFPKIEDCPKINNIPVIYEFVQTFCSELSNADLDEEPSDLKNGYFAADMQERRI